MDKYGWIFFNFGCRNKDGRQFCEQPVGILFAAWINNNNHPPLNVLFMNYHDYKKCIDACLRCAAMCNHCASACLKENDVKMMTACIQLDMECATACYAAAQLMSLGSDRADEYCRLCVDLCEACAEECGRHDNQHCQECARACRDCAEECVQMVAA